MIKATNKKKVTIVLSVVLVLTIAIGATLAYLFTKTEEKENVFTFAQNVKATLDEPNWDPDKGLDLTPNKKVEKDPQITNTSINGLVEYAAIKLTFLNGEDEIIDDADVATLLSLVDVEWSNNWTLVDGGATDAEQIYVYNETLPQGVTSDPIFYSLTVKNSVTPAQLLWLAGDYGHDEATCYEFGTCDCTTSERHHEKCAVNAATPDTCDCTTSIIHEIGCASLVGSLIDDCGHDTFVGLGNFTIKVEGAVVQADAFEDLAEATPDLISLFS